MSIDPSPRSRTIDDLGIETYNAYAKNQELLDPSLIKEGARVSSQTRSEVMTPSFTSEFETLFETKKRHQVWALFDRPPNYLVSSSLLFSYQLIPSLGSEENTTFLRQRIQERVEKLRKRNGKDSKKPLFEQEIDLKENEEESKKLMAFLDILDELDKLLVQANGRRSQYQRG